MSETKKTTQPAPVQRRAEQVLAEEFLLARSKILDLAATLDRLQRAEGTVENLDKRQLLQQGLEILLDDQGDKAKRVQLLMSCGCNTAHSQADIHLLDYQSVLPFRQLFANFAQ